MSTPSEFPVPARRGQIIIGEHGALLPTVPGMVSGIVDDQSPDAGVTVQCAVCLRTATGRDPGSVVVIGGWHFENDTEPGQRWPLPGPTRHRRCPDCRRARRHPEQD